LTSTIIVGIVPPSATPARFFEVYIALDAAHDFGVDLPGPAGW
jgi:hypothetical protein